MRIYIVTALAACFFLKSAVVCAQEPVVSIVERANRVAYYEGDDGRALVTMTITDAQGRIRTRQFVILRKDDTDGGEQKYYVYFKEPSDVRGMTYMVWKHLDRDDDRWLYLPALDLVRRIAAGDKRSSFVGSHFVYEDVSGRALALDAHLLLSSDADEYVVRNTPHDPSGVEFAYFDVHIDKKTYMPFKGEYYDDKGLLIRTIEALSIKDIAGHPTVTRSKATDITTGAFTVMEFKDVSYDIGLDESVFTERFLRRPPQQWLR